MEAPPNSIHPKTRAEWRKWLEENQARTEWVWLINFKKATGKPCVEYDEAVEEAVHWIAFNRAYNELHFDEEETATG